MKLTPEQKLKLLELALQKKQADDAKALRTEVKGEKGDIPKHKWVGTSLAFENIDGTFGELVDLKGDQGERGEKGDKGESGKDGKDATLTEEFKTSVVETVYGAMAMDISAIESKIEELKSQHSELYKHSEEPIDGAEVVDAINALDTDDNSLKIDASHIKNLPKFVQDLQNVGAYVHFLSALNDVNVSGATDAQVLTYNATTGKWEAADAAGGTGSGDVTAASNFGNDNRIIRSDGVTKGVQSSGVTLSDTDSISGLVNTTSTGQFLSADGSVSAPTYSFSGDTDTGWYRVGSTLRYAKDGIERIRITSGGNISVNNNATGIATSNGIFHGTYDADPQDQDGIVVIDTYSSEGWTTTIGGRRARGTAAAPSQIMSGDKIVEFIGKGWDGHGDFCPSNRALMGFYANEDWNSSTNNGTYITLNTTTDGTGANHTSLLIDDEGNVAVNSATTNITTTVFPSTWAATSSKHFAVISGGINRDAGIFIRNSDSTAGLDTWLDTSARFIYHDSLVDHASASHIFRLRTLGTAVTPLTLDISGALLGVGSNLRLQGGTSGTATIVAPAAAGTPTLTLPTTSGTFLTSADKISAHAATTSAELAGVISDETGSGSLVFATSPTLVTPTLGTFAATAGTITNTITNYNGIATAGNGLASVVATGGATGQTAALAATTIFAVPASKGGMYMVCVNANITRGATTSSILGNVDVTFTSPTDSVAKTLLDGNVNQYNRTAGNTTADGVSITFPVYAKASTNIQLAIGYTSSGATTMEYEYRYSVIYLG